MTALMNAKLLAQTLINRPSLVYAAVRNAAHWNKDFQAGKVPETEKEHREAAKKYNLLPEEYNTYPDNGQGYGDYPKLSDAPIESRDPYYPWDFPEHKRNFNEPVHVDVDLIGEDRYGTAEPLRFSMSTYWLAFLASVGGALGLYYFLDDKRMFRPVLPKQYAGDGKVHYTFETK